MNCVTLKPGLSVSLSVVMLSFTVTELKLDAGTYVRSDPGNILGERKNSLCLKAQQISAV